MAIQIALDLNKDLWTLEVVKAVAQTEKVVLDLFV